MRIAIRADASEKIGHGHVMRCLTLASGLNLAGADVSLLSRDLPIELETSVLQAQCQYYELPKWIGNKWQDDALSSGKILSANDPLDWLIVDHYGLDYKWEQQMRRYTKRIFAIDDLADRQHLTDVLLDPNYPDDAVERYRGKLPANCLVLSGTNFVLLREEFISERASRDNNNRTNLLIQFGGADPINCTAFTIRALAPILAKGVPCDVVVGGAYTHLADLHGLLNEYHFPKVNLYVATNDMATLISHARLAVAGGGTSVWERCCLGLPSIVMAIAENQFKPLERLQETGAVKSLGYAHSVDPNQLRSEVEAIWSDSKQLQIMGEFGQALVDGNGLRRVLDVITSEFSEVIVTN